MADTSSDLGLHIMATQIIPRACGAATTNYYRSLAPTRRAALAFEMATEVKQHYDRTLSLVMVLTERLREETKAGDSMTLDLAEIAAAWLSDGDHCDQQRRLMACLLVAKDASHG